jgi:hypothetical protein
LSLRTTNLPRSNQIRASGAIRSRRLRQPAIARSGHRRDQIPANATVWSSCRSRAGSRREQGCG